MIIRSCGGVSPAADPTVRAADNVSLIGDVRLEEDVTLWYGAVLRGDVAPIRIGRGSNLQDHVTVHCAYGAPTTVGRDVVVGHGAILHSCTVEDGCLVGMGSILLDGCVIGEGAIVGAGTLVPPGKVIPPRSVVMGVPGRVVRAVSERELLETRENARRYVSLGAEQLRLVREALGSTGSIEIL